MSVIVKDLKMPNDCVMCPMVHWNACGDLTGCDVVPGKKYVSKNDKDYWESNERPKWCPLIDIDNLTQTLLENVIDQLENEILYGLHGKKKA